MPRKSPPPAPPPTWDEVLINALLPYRVQAVGFVLFILFSLTLLALPGWTQSSLLTVWTELLRNVMGWGAYIFALSGTAIGLHLTLHKVEKPYRIHPSQIVGIELLFLTLLPLSHQLTKPTLPEVLTGRGGGIVGWALSEPLLEFFGPILSVAIYLVLLVLGIALTFNYGWNDLLETLEIFSEQLQVWAKQIETGRPAQPPPEPIEVPPPILQPRPATASKPVIKVVRLTPSQRHRLLPSISLLTQGHEGQRPTDEIDKKKDKIVQTLLDFGLPVTITQIRRGPAVTQFGVRPGYIQRTSSDGQTKEQKVRVGQIASLQKDLALTLAVPRLRVQAPVPGQGVVGIEVPNDNIDIVRLRSVIESAAFIKIGKPLAVALGRDVSGVSIATDLAKLPHLLIAGTTGSGKSICMNALITCLIFNNTPDKLNLIMIDPKKVELIRFKGLPHLIGTVEVEADRAVGVLRWLTAEMDRRYEMFSQFGARNITVYNTKIKKRQKGNQLPYIAVFIDELADLMHTYPGDVERTLCRLAQMARATGIHLVVATQRPSTDVITGLIKANFPARLSFAVASGTDSRVILDTVGAENLLGKGDMLFLSPEAAAPSRIQGVFVDDTEIENLVNYWQRSLPNFEPIPTPWDSLIARHALLNQTDTLLEEAIELAKKYETISTSLLQRRLRLGYPRAARIMQHLYEMGLVEDPKSGGKTRRTLVSEKDEDPLGDFLTQQR